MKNEIIWFDRKFDFMLPAELFPLLVERLRGTPARLEEKLFNVSEAVLAKKIDNTWSIKEQTGHLCVVEDLWIGRMEDYINNADILRPADLKNTKTKESDFNHVDIDNLLLTFRQKREKFIVELDRIKPNEVEKTARHPRLDKPMRIIDLAFFAAEHDDHHLAKMTDRLRA